MKDYFIPIIMAKIKKTINTKHWTGYEATGELSLTVDVNNQQ